MIGRATQRMTMISVTLCALGLGLAQMAVGQSLADPASGPLDQPRAMTLFASAQGYDDLPEARHGTLMAPDQNELGLLLVFRMFRNVCLGLENGASLAEVLPDPFVGYDQSSYFFAEPVAPQGGSIAASPTGDVDLDEGNGHPVFWIKPDAAGMTCKIEWYFDPDLPDSTVAAMADLLDTWLPFGLALARASRPLPQLDPAMPDLTEWDRPCNDRWCRLDVLRDLGRGFVSIETLLDRTTPEGDRP